MIRDLLARPDLRHEIVGALVVAVIIVALDVSHRRPEPTVAPSREAYRSLAVAPVTGEKLDLMTMEYCPERQLAVVVVRAEAGLSTGPENPISTPRLSGLREAGGVWSGPAARGMNFEYTGAGGRQHSLALSPGQGAAALRFRGVLALKPTPFCLTFLGQPICFPALTPRATPPAEAGLAGEVLGK